MPSPHSTYTARSWTTSIVVHAAVLIALGISRFFGHGHVRWVRMQVGLKDLTLWSFLMASAHGAGLMVLPAVLGTAVAAHCDLHTAPGLAASAWATVIHSGAYLAVSTAIAAVVFEKIGVAFLRTAWLNLDLIWAAALVMTGVVTVLS